MVSQVTQNLFATSYKDDYRDSDNYHRILFNSGRALQARELTQMQTIIQNEIARFGRNIFNEGAAVLPGGPTLNTNYEFVKLNTASNALPTNPQSLVGNIFVGATSNLRGKILEVVPAENSDPATLYVQYLGDASSTTTQLRFIPGENLTDGTTTLTVQTTNTTANPAIGRGTRYSIAGGTFFALGHFVFAETQSLIVQKYSPSYTGTIGFLATEQVVTAEDNAALYDNQGELLNTSAPGADRYQIRLTLIDKADVAADEIFIFMSDIVESEIVDVATATSGYNEINTLLALRTSEESGNYVVRPFKLKFNEDSDANFLIADISEGTAYINGFRASINKRQKIRFQKPTTTSTFNNEVVAANYGNFIEVDTLVGVPNVNEMEQWNLRDSASFQGSTIGTARIRSVEEDGSIYKLSLFDIQMSGNNSFRSVKSIGADSANYANLILLNNIAVLNDAANNDLFFPLPTTRPASLTDISYEAQKRFTATTDASGNASLGSGLLAAGETWSGLSDWVVVIDSSGENVSSTVSISGAGTTTATITGTGAGTSNLEVLAFVNKSAATSRAKTLTETTVTGTIDSDGNGLKYLDLGKADIYDVLRIRGTDSDGTDLTSTFRLDNGQRDNFYDVGKLIVRSGRGVPAGNVFARFRYFAHGAGDFFSVNSYTIDYADIPSHTLANGDVIQLRDVLDFRPRVNDAGTGFTGSTAKVNPLPKNTDLITLDATNYLGRNDKLVIGQDARFKLIQGAPDVSPQFPTVPENSLELYRIRLNPNTLNASDMSIQMIDNRRYTMRDIGQLDKRITRLEDTTALNLLEINTNTLQVLDSAGLPRTKAGFLADNFGDHRFSDTVDPNYMAAIDPRQKILRPAAHQENIRLIYDSDLSTNTIKKGDNIYIKYDEAEMIFQDEASGVENINAFAVVINEGVIELSPASDEWRETEFAAARAVDGGTRLDANNAFLFNEWQWNWQGQAEQSDNLTGTVFGTQTTNQGFVQTTTTDRVVGDETIREVIGERVVDVAIIPFMRSRMIHFRAFGLIPNQQFYAFFDETDVNDWVRQETFTRMSDDPEDFGNRFQNSTTHPDGATTLSSDANGVLEGAFFIPNTNAIRFRTGRREFRLSNANSARAANSTSLASGFYEANGVIETVEQTIQSTRVITVRGDRTVIDTTPPPPPPRDDNIDVVVQPVVVQPVVEEDVAPVTEGGGGGGKDPLSQSFFVPEDDGVFVTKIRVYFASKPDVAGGANPAPVALELRPMVNGHPSADTAVPGGLAVLTPNQVTVVPEETEASMLANGTDFIFDEPVYLRGRVEYALCLLADTVDYTVYVAEPGEFIIGSTEKRITRQPLLGSLFKSQNGRTWTADQTKDMTFRIYKANFLHQTAEAVMQNAVVPRRALFTDPFEFDSGDNWVTVSHPYHGFDSGDTVSISGLDSATTYAGILGTSILGNRTVAQPDMYGYRIYADSSATSSIVGGGNLVEATRNIMFDIINPTTQILLPSSRTNIAAAVKLTSGRSLAGTETRYIKDPNYSSIRLNDNNIANAPRMIGNSAVETVEIADKSATVAMRLATIDNNISPVIDMQRTSLSLFNNLIDKQDSDRDAVGFNTPLIFVPETDADGGSHLAKHFTTPITLAENAVGLRVLLAANKPSVADFQVYYRTADEGTNIRNVDWELVNPENSVPSDENPNIFREYRYLVGGLGGTLNPFTTYQLKIVFRSTSSSKVPVIKDLRVIALAT
jgi:hypothetical protein